MLVVQFELIYQFFFLYLSFSFAYHHGVHIADGLIWVSEWNALQHPVAAAFLAALYSDYMLTSRSTKLECDGDTYKPSDIRKFVRSQVCFLMCLKYILHICTGVSHKQPLPFINVYSFLICFEFYRRIMSWATIL